MAFLVLVHAEGSAQGMGIDPLLFQPFRSSDPTASALFDGSLSTSVPFVQGFWVEVELTPDAEGRPLMVDGYRVEGHGGSMFDWVRVLVKPEFPNRWEEIWNGPFLGTMHIGRFPYPRRIISIRLEALSSPVNPRFLSRFSMDLHSSFHSFQALDAEWYGNPPSTGTRTSLVLQTRAAQSDQFAVLLGASGLPLLIDPLRSGPTWAGGLLLDPLGMHVVAIQPVAGSLAWTWDCAFPWHPLFTGQEVHFQVVFVDLISYIDPILSWTRPITLLL